MKYLSQDQVCDALGVSPEELKSMVVDGRLRQFRDDGKIVYSADEVDHLQSMEGSSIVDLAVTDDVALTGESDNESYASALSSLADSSSDLSLLDDSAAPGVTPRAGGEEELSLADFPDDLPAAPAKRKKDDLSSEIGLLPSDEGSSDSIETIELSSDVDLTGSSIIGLEDAEDERPRSKDDTRITKAGISVFDDDELEIDSDPMAKTHVPGMDDEIGGASGGSGLLDLTRESDDTSLGAELLDVISPTEAEETEAAATVDDDAVVAAAPEDDTAEVPAMMGGNPFPAAAGPRRAVGAMAGAVPVNVCMLFGLISLALLGLVGAGAVQGVWPSFLNVIVGGADKMPIYASVFGGLVVITLITGIIGILAGRK